MQRRLLRFVLGVALCLAPPAVSRAATLYVSTGGRAGWSGSMDQPNAQQTDGPLPSPAAARDKIRQLRREGASGDMTVLLRGRPVALETRPRDGVLEIWFDNERVQAGAPAENLRPAVEQHLRALAQRELTARAVELARQHGVPMRRVTVRNQKSRWGSCSVRGTISLNWRLIQVPEPVRDYLILHELMHLRNMNHSARFWAEVEKVCPDYRAAEDWLKHHSAEVGF